MDTPDTMAASLLAAAVAVAAESAAVVRKGAGKVKDEARKNALRSAPTRHAGAPYTIGYDVTVRRTTTEAVIGYDKDRPGGALGNLLEFGGGKDHSPPHRDLGRALDAEEPNFLRAMGEVGVGVLSGRMRR